MDKKIDKEYPNFSKGGGLIPVIVQDEKTNEVLMCAYMNKEAYQKTLKLKQMVYFSRSRGTLWHKGATSGNFQNLVALYLDCDGDTLLAKVHQMGCGACHTGRVSCFYKVVGEDGFVGKVN